MEAGNLSFAKSAVIMSNGFPSPDKNHLAQWRLGGEMWMSGPEWGWLTVDGRNEIKGATPDVMWSGDSQFVAFVKLHIDDVPNRQGDEGFSFRVGIMRMSDFKVRYCLGNNRLSRVRIKSITPQSLSVSVDGELKTVNLRSINWSNP